MDRKTVEKLIKENLHTVFAWSISKLYDKNDAEDLAQDIICDVLKSAHRLENDEAFFGFMWKIAENTLCARLLRRELSLLSSQYREATVRYYIYGKSCSEISDELNISIEMVKYYLFKTRKILEEVYF